MPKTNSDDSKRGKRAQLSQTAFPNNNLEASLRIAQALWDNFTGTGAAPHDVAMVTFPPWMSSQ